MAINQPLPTRLTPLDKAVIDYHMVGEDFIRLLDPYISSFPESKRYVFFGPNMIILGHEETLTDPMNPKSPKRSPYWYVVYAQGEGLACFLKSMPYYLDTIGFSRYIKYPNRPVRYLSTDKLLTQYGLKTTNTTRSTSAAATPTAAATTCSKKPCKNPSCSC